MRESEIEKKLIREVRRMGGLADKFVSPGNRGVADRIVILPGGQIYFVELKTEIGELSRIQKWQRKRYMGLGVNYRVLYGMADVEEFLSELSAIAKAGERGGDAE